MNDTILVFGMPRSGTTWIGKLFDSHPDTLYRHEPDSLKRLSLSLYPEMETASRYRPELEQFIASLPGMRSPEVIGKQPLFAKSYLSATELFAYRASVIAAKATSRIWRNATCPYRPTAAKCAQARVVWKSIESLGRLGVCMKALHGVRAIHLMRHPCGYVTSVLRGRAAYRFTGETPDTDDSWRLKMLLATATGSPYKARMGDPEKLTHEEQLAWTWTITHEKTLADIAHSGGALTVRYEDVCADPSAMTRKMLEFTGLQWHPQIEAFIRASTGTTGRTTDTDYYSVFKSPMTSAERWRSELAPEAVERIMQIFLASPLARFYIDGGRVSNVLPEVVA